MVEKTASIRPYGSQDDKLVRFIIGKASMETLAVANRRAIYHPLSLSAWLLLSYAIVKYMNLWPTDQFGFLGYLKPIPMMAASFVPVIFLIDWLNRPDFEQLTQEVLRGPDMVNIREYYSRSPTSGLWIFEYGGLFAGLIALDANPESTVAPSKTGRKPNGKTETKNVSSTTAVIRHLYVDDAYRNSGIQEDLLAYALRIAFGSNSAVQMVKAYDSPLITYVSKCLQQKGFVRGDLKQKVGVFGWQHRERVLTREDWEEETTKSK